VAAYLEVLHCMTWCAASRAAGSARPVGM
jgi:hypothetical protein